MFEKFNPTKTIISRIIKKTFECTRTNTKNYINVWIQCGIFPYGVEQLLSRLPTANRNKNVGETFIEYLKVKISKTILPTKKGKKIKILAGTSFAHIDELSDIETSESEEAI